MYVRYHAIQLMMRLLAVAPAQTQDAVLSQPAISSIGSFFAAKLPDDERRLMMMLAALQKGEWAVLAGRVDQASAVAPAVASKPAASPPAAPAAPGGAAADEQKWMMLQRLLESGEGGDVADGAMAAAKAARSQQIM